MSRNSYPIVLARAAHVLAFTDVLRTLGTPLHQVHRRFRLPDLDAIQPNMYVPVGPALCFFAHMERKEGIDDLGFLASQQDNFHRLSSELVRISRSAPTLHARLCQFARLAPFENTHVRVSLVREGDHVRVVNDLAGCPEPGGLRYSEWIQLIVLVELVRQSVAPEWQPSEITFQSRFAPTSSALEQFPNTRMVFGHRHTSIKVPASLIFRPPAGHHGQQAACPIDPENTDMREPTPDFPGSLKLVLRSYLRDGYPDVRLAAEIAGTSVRTLQRRLAQFGLSYGDLVLRARFEVASELLKDPHIKSCDVGYEVGYSDPSNFSRAFRRVAGISPEEYRRHHS